MVDRLDAEEETIRAEAAHPASRVPPGVNRMDFKALSAPATVSYTLTVTGKRASTAIRLGLLFNSVEAHNQHGELVYSADLVGFSKLRDYKMPLRLKLAMALRNIPGIGKVFGK